MEGGLYRINHLCWWAQELPSQEEMQEGFNNLALNGNTVDYIVSHCCATSTLDLIDWGMYQSDILTDYFEELRQTIRFKKWFFGHFHDNMNVSEDEILLYEQIIRIT